MILGYELWKWLVFLFLVTIVVFFTTILTIAFIKTSKN